MNRILLLMISLVPSLVNSQDKRAVQRKEYLKAHSIIVPVIELDDQVNKTLSKEVLTIVQNRIKMQNRNLKIGFKLFWDISDTILFVSSNEIKNRKLEFKHDIFLTSFKWGTL